MRCGGDAITSGSMELDPFVQDAIPNNRSRAEKQGHTHAGHTGDLSGDVGQRVRRPPIRIHNENIR